MTISTSVGVIVILALLLLGVGIVFLWIAFAVAEIIGKLDELEALAEQMFNHYVDWVARQ